jgi:hypothetical protein
MLKRTLSYTKTKSHASFTSWAMVQTYVNTAKRIRSERGSADFFLNDVWCQSKHWLLFKAGTRVSVDRLVGGLKVQ